MSVCSNNSCLLISLLREACFQEDVFFSFFLQRNFHIGQAR